MANRHYDTGSDYVDNHYGIGEQPPPKGCPLNVISSNDNGVQEVQVRLMYDNRIQMHKQSNRFHGGYKTERFPPAK